MRDRPKPEMAPYLPAADVVKQNDKKKPIQLKRNATGDRKTIISHHQSNTSLKGHLYSKILHLVTNQLWASDNKNNYMTVHGASADLLKGFLLKKVSMKIPSFPIRSWSASSKSSLATKSSSCTSKKKKCIYVPSTCFVLITQTGVASVYVILWWLEWSGVSVNN